MSKAQKFVNDYRRITGSEEWKKVDPQKRAEVESSFDSNLKYYQELDEQEARQQAATPTTQSATQAPAPAQTQTSAIAPAQTDSAPIKPYEPPALQTPLPSSTDIARKFNRIKNSNQWDSMDEEQREAITDQARTAHRNLLSSEGFDPGINAKQVEYQEFFKPYMAPAPEPTTDEDFSLGRFAKANAKSALQIVPNLASGFISTGGTVTDAIGKGTAKIPGLGTVGNALSELGQSAIGISDVMDSWTNYHLPPEQKMPETVQEFMDMSAGQKAMLVGDQALKQVGTMVVPAGFGMAAGKAAMVGMKGQKATGVLKPFTNYLASKGPAGAQAFGGFVGSTMQAAGEMGKRQMQEAGDTNPLATLIAAPIAGKLESLVPASAEYLVSGLKGASRKAFSEAMKSPVKFLTHVAKEMGKSGLTESATEIAQESVQKYAVEWAKGDQGTGVMDVANRVSEILRTKGFEGLIEEAKTNKEVGELAMAGILGGITGGMFEGGGRSFAGAKYLASPVRHYDNMINAKTDEEREAAKQAFNKVSELGRQQARQEAAFRSISDLEDVDADAETVEEAFNVLKDMKRGEREALYQTMQQSGWVPNEIHQERLAQFFKDQNIEQPQQQVQPWNQAQQGQQPAQQQPQQNQQPGKKGTVEGQPVAAGDDYYGNLERLANEITHGQGKEFDEYNRAIENSPEPERPAPLRHESPEELTSLFPPEDLITKKESAESGKEMPGLGWRGHDAVLRLNHSDRTPYRGYYALVDADKLKTTLTQSEIQNRQRQNNAVSDEQIKSIRDEVDPDGVISNDRFVNDGPMVVRPIKNEAGEIVEFEVVSGNGRTTAIKEGYAQGKMEPLRHAYAQRAQEFGLSPESAYGAPKPVLVRVLEEGEQNIRKFVEQANEGRQLGLSSGERAPNDAVKILPFISEIKADNLAAPSNETFIKDFFDKVIGKQGTSKGNLLLSDGRPSTDGYNRIRNAIFGAAYGDPHLVTKLAEDPENEVRDIVSGLQAAAIDSARLAASASQNAVYPVNLGQILPNVLRKIEALRAEKVPLEDYFSQGQFGADGLSREERILLGTLAKAKSYHKVKDLVKAFNNEVRKYGPPGQMAFDGMENSGPQVEALLRSAVDKVFPEFNEQIDKWAQGPAALMANFSKKKGAPTGNEKLIQILEQIGTNADPETAKASNRLVDIINAIGPDPETLNANIAKSDNETAKSGQKDAPYFSAPAEKASNTQISREELEAVADVIRKNLDPSIRVPVLIVETTEELSRLVGQRVPKSVDGALINNKTYLVRENLPDAKRAYEVAAHEIIGHKGLSDILGREWKSFARSFEQLGKTDPAIAQEIADARRDYATDRDALGQIDEALARTAEQYAADPSRFSDKAKAWFNDTLAKIQDALRALGFDINFNARDLARTMRAAKSAMTRSGEFSNKAGKTGVIDTYEKAAEVDRHFEDSGMGEIWKYSKKVAAQTLNKEKFLRKLKKNPLWDVLTPEQQRDLIEKTEHGKGGLERRLRKANNEYSRKFQKAGSPISALLKKKYPKTPYAEFMPDSGEASIEAFDIAKDILAQNPNLKAFRGMIDVKNLKTINDASKGEHDANNKFLKYFAQYFKESVDSISNNNLLVKFGGDEWDSFVIVPKNVEEDDIRRYLMIAHKKAVQHAISMGIKETAENPRAPQPRGLGESLAANYKSGYVTPGIEKLVDDYAKDMWKYLTGRGMGFRIGISEIKSDQSFNESAEDISKQHKAEKEGESLDPKIAEEYRQIVAGNVARIRRGEEPIRFSVKRKMAGDVSEGKSPLQEIPAEQRRSGRSGSETGETRIPGNERVLPSRLEQLIQQIGPEETQAPKTTGNKLVDIISSIETDTHLKTGESEFFIPADPPKFSKKSEDKSAQGAKQLTLDLLLPAGDSAQKKEETAALVESEQFFTEVKQVKVGAFKHKLKSVKDHKDVATIMSPLTKDPREQSAIIVLDEKRVPLAIFRVASGEKTSVSMHPQDVFGGAVRVPGAKSFYTIHNHPSGNNIPFNADLAINRRFAEISKGLGIEYNGSVILAHNFDSETIHATFAAPDGSTYFDTTTKSGDKDRKKVDSFKNEFESVRKPAANLKNSKDWFDFVGPNEVGIKVRDLKDKIRSLTEKGLELRESAYGEKGVDPDALNSIYKELEQAKADIEAISATTPKKAIVAFVSNANDIVARIEMDPSELTELRQGDLKKGAGRILQAVDRSNATGMIVHIPPMATQQTYNLARNLDRFGSAFDLRILDVTSYYDDGRVGYISARESGMLDTTDSAFFSKKKGEKGLGDVRYSYAGVKAKQRPAGVTTWEEAQKLLNSGKSAEEVRIQTGWFVSPYDKRPRFELDDSRANLKLNIDEEGMAHRATTLDRILEHKDLFEAYPKLSGMLTTIDIDPANEIGGSYHRGTPGTRDYFGTEPEIKIAAPNIESAKGALFHEIQHAIQDTEEFARGGSPGMFEAETETDARRRGSEAWAKKAREIFENASDEFRAAAREMNRAYDINLPMSKQSEEYRQARKDLMKNFGDEGGYEYIEFSDKADKVWRGENALGPDGKFVSPMSRYDQYRRLAGEIEARDVEDRIDLDAEERSAYGPFETSEYGPEEAIIRYSIGDKFKNVEKSMPIDDVEPTKIRPKTKDVRGHVTDLMNSWPQTIMAADGNEILLHSPERGSIRDRAWHLVRNSDTGKLDVSKLEWVPNIPSTLENAAIRMIDSRNNNRLYVRGYRSGEKHIVVVAPNGAVESHGVFNGSLITQFKYQPGKKQGDMIVEWENKTKIREGGAQEPPRLHSEDLGRANEPFNESDLINSKAIGEPPSDPNITLSDEDVKADFSDDSDAKFSKKREESGPNFYSEMERTLTKPGMLPKKASKADMISAIQKHVGKFKKVELEESGLIEHLEGMQEDQVTSQDVADYLEMSKIEIEETTLDDDSGGPKKTWTKYGSYVTPGGKNYKELLLTIPEKGRVVYTKENVVPIYSGDVVDRPDLLWYFRTPDNVLQISKKKFAKEQDALNYILSEKQPDAPADKNFHSNHWDQGNVLLHARFNEREDSDGNRILFIEEIQSDWHQAGRKKGYGKPSRELVDAATSRRNQMASEQAAKGKTVDDFSAAERAEWDRLFEIIEKSVDGVPDAPFKQTDRWAMLGMKRMIQWAAENGFDRVAWAPGDVQAERYDLSKQISEIIYQDNNSSGMGRARLDGPPSSGMLIAYDENQKKVINQFVQPEQLEDYIGKEAAKKLLESTPTAQSSAGIGVRQRKLSGVDLKVGGEGMKGFYDRILPSEVNKYVKKWGASVYLTPMAQDPSPYQSDADGLLDELDELDKQYESRSDEKMWGFDVTPAMKNAVSAGQPLYSKKKEADQDPFDPKPEPLPDLKEVGESAARDFVDLLGKAARGLIASTSAEEALQQPYFKRAKQNDPEAETEYELTQNTKNQASNEKKKAQDSGVLSHLEADKNLIVGLIKKMIPKGDLQDWALKKASRVLAPHQAAKPIERILFVVAENMAYDAENDTLKLSPGIRHYIKETGEYQYIPSEHAPAAMHFFQTLAPEWQRLMIDRARENEEYRQQFENVIIPHAKAKTAIALLARYRQMGADKSALEGAESEARSMLKQVEGKIEQQEYNDLKGLLDQLLNIPADKVMKMPTVIEGIIRDAKKDLKSPAALQAELKRLNTNKGHYGYVHHYFESEQIPSQGKAFDAFGNIPNGWIESVPATQKLRSGTEGFERNLLKADIAKAKKEIAAEASNSWMRKVEDQFGLPVEEFKNLSSENFPEGYEKKSKDSDQKGERRAVVANFGKYKGQEIYLPNNIFDHYQLVRERGIEDPVVRKYEKLFQTVEGVADRMNLAMLYHTGKFGRDLMAAPFHIFDFMYRYGLSNPRELPFLIKAMTKAVGGALKPSTWQKYTPELEGEYSESLPLYNKTDNKSYLTMAGDSIGSWVTKTVPVGQTIAALLEEINLAGAADLPLKRIMRSVGEQLADKKGLKGKDRERFVFNVVDDGAFVTQNLPPVIAMLRGQNPNKTSKSVGAIMRTTIPFMGYSTKLVKSMFSDPVTRGIIPMGKRAIGKADPDSHFLKEMVETSRPFVWLAMKAFILSGLGGLIPPEEEAIASEMQDSKFLDPTARTHGRILISQDKSAEDPESGELWLSTKGFSHLQAIDALADIVSGKSSIRDFSTEFLTIHPGMQYFLDILGLSNSYNEKVSFGAKTGKILAQAAVPQLLRYGPELAKLWRAVQNNNTIPDATKQNFFTAGLEQLGFPIGKVKVDKDGNVRTSLPWVELVKQVGPNIRKVPFNIVSEAVEAEVKGLDPLRERAEKIMDYMDGRRNTDLSERQFLAQVLKTNRWATVRDALKDTTEELKQRGLKTMNAAAKLQSKGAPIATEREKKEVDPIEKIVKRIENRMPKEPKNRLEEIIRSIGDEPEKAKKTFDEEIQEMLDRLN